VSVHAGGLTKNAQNVGDRYGSLLSANFGGFQIPYIRYYYYYYGRPFSDVSVRISPVNLQTYIREILRNTRAPFQYVIRPVFGSVVGLRISGKVHARTGIRPIFAKNFSAVNYATGGRFSFPTIVTVDACVFVSERNARVKLPTRDSRIRRERNAYAYRKTPTDGTIERLSGKRFV